MILEQMTSIHLPMSYRRSTLKTTMSMQRFVSSCNTCVIRDLSSSFLQVNIGKSAEMIFFDHES